MQSGAGRRRMRKRKTRLCARCRVRPATYKRPSDGRVVAADDGHNICLRCYADLMERIRQRRRESS
jgi:hypothetical protein